MLKAVKGIYKNGAIELSETPSDISESQVIVTFLDSKSTPQSTTMMQFGMFAGSQQSCEEDFQIAEFQGDAQDGLDWS